MSNIDPSHDEITRRARSLWEERGRPEGQDDEIWLDAERSLRGSGSDRDADGNPSFSASAAADKGRKAQRRNGGDSGSRSPVPDSGKASRSPRNNTATF